MKERILILCIGALMDLLFGDPHWLWHPVQGIGWLIDRMVWLLGHAFRWGAGREDDRGKKRAAGVILVCVVLAVSTGVPMLLLYAAGRIAPWLRFALSCILCWQMLAAKSLRVESMKVYTALKKEDVEGARKAVSMIVGRDTQRLSREGIARAAVETVAENTSDGVIAPLLFMMLFGVCGGVFYKAVNTMDSMVGYKNDAYRYLGTAAAKLDDIMNFIPARVSALAMIGAALCLGMDWKGGFRIFKRDRYQHASPNSAQTEAVCAGALGVRLAGDAWYFGELHHKPTIGDAHRQIEAEDIRRANRLMLGTFAVVFLAGLAVMLAAVWLG